MSDRCGAAAGADQLTSTAPIPAFRRVAWLALAVSSVAALVVACGGGGGVGTNGTGSVNFGTVTGFGSVIVDGVRYDDSKALVQLESNSSLDLAEVKLGHRTLIDGSNGADDTATGVATRIELDPSLTGYVEAVGLLDKSISMLGQTVFINEGASALVPVTVLDGYPNIAAINLGDAVEIHAIRQVTLGGVNYYATRIEKQISTPTLSFVRVAGVVSAYNNQSFQLGGLTVVVDDSTQRSPSGSKLADGVSVVVYAAAVTPTGPPSAPVNIVTANKIRVRSAASSADLSYVSGLVSNVQGSAFSVDGVTVRFSASLGAPTDGSYVRVRGTRNSDGSYTASRIQPRQSDDDSGSELRGNVIQLTANSFVVRDTKVLFVDGTTPINCLGQTAALQLANSPFVEVKGRTGPSGVIAKSIKCDNSAGSDSSATITRIGTASQLDTGNKSFLLSTTSGNVTVNYTVNNLLRGITEANLQATASLEVEGMLSGTTLTATKIKPESAD